MTEIFNRPDSGRVPLGTALEKVRCRVGYSVHNASAALGISPAALGRIESGLSTPNAELVVAMASLYGVEPDCLGSRDYVARVPARYDSETDTLWLGWYQVDLDPTRDSNEKLYRSVAAALRSLRSLDERSPVMVRRVEVAILARLTRLGDEDLPYLMMRYLKLSLEQSHDLIKAMAFSLRETPLLLNHETFEKQSVQA